MLINIRAEGQFQKKALDSEIPLSTTNYMKFRERNAAIDDADDSVHLTIQDEPRLTCCLFLQCRYLACREQREYGRILADECTVCLPNLGPSTFLEIEYWNCVRILETIAMKYLQPVLFKTER